MASYDELYQMPKVKFLIFFPIWYYYQNFNRNITSWFYILKIELHAHLSGSVPKSTLYTILNEDRSKNSDLLAKFNEITNEERDLDSCFRLFPIVHQILNNKDNLIRVTKDVLAHFESINVVYLELRTTPRHIQDESTKEIVLTKKEYI